ncbi:MAG: hypothetical protein K2X61_02915 [Caulobacteraceae bacterium]|nr:hypothetical protein [Caulobacteraceae bacterium]
MTRLLAPLINPVRSPLWAPVAGARGRRRGAGVALPVVASYSQSSNFGGAGVEAANLTNMQDSLAEPFAATAGGPGFEGSEWVQLTLNASTFVNAVTLMAPTTTGGWGPSYLNTRILQRTNDPSPGTGSAWTNVVVSLSGFTAGSSQTFSVGAACTALRIINPSGTIYVAVGDFRVA